MLGDELGLGRPGGYHAWVGKTVHTILEQVEKGEIAKDPRAMVAELDARWRPQEFPSMAVSTAFYAARPRPDARNWFEHYGERPAAGIERFFEFEFEGATIVGYIDRIGPAVQDGYVHHRLQDRQERQAPEAAREPAARHLLPRRAGIADLAEFRPVKTVELAFLRGNWKSADIDYRKWLVTERDEQAYQAEMRERLAG